MPEELRCPKCGDVHLHHRMVEVYEPHGEDERRGVKVVVKGDWFMRRAARVEITGDMDNNPSSRRNGIRVRMWCENCEQQASLTIVQHKGQTLLEWEPSQDRV